MDDILKVGQLAKETGLSVRTLHYYDQIGLLTPAMRSRSGYRLYSHAEILRLQQITSLRQLGLSLEEVAGVLERPGSSLVNVLDRHVQGLHEQLEGLKRLLARLERIRQRLADRQHVPTHEFLTTIKESIMYEKYYSPEQLEQLRQRRDEVGEERIQQVQQEWMELFESFRRAMEAGQDPGSEPVRALGRRSLALIQEFTGGDPGIESSLSNMCQAEGPTPVNQQEGFSVDPALWGYMARAQAAARDDG